MHPADDATVSAFAPPWWLRNGHLQTVWARFLGRRPDYSRNIAATADGDEIAIDHLAGVSPASPVLCLFHGLEGCSQSHTVRQLACWFHERGWSIFVPHFRSCGGLMNKLPRAYHAGDSADVGWMLRHVKARCPKNRGLCAAGISLGGNALAKWLGENPGQKIVRAAAAVCPPFDLADSSKRIDRKLNRCIYSRHFLPRLVDKVKTKLARYPFLVDERKLATVATLREFDELYTAPVHSFANADDYYRRASALATIDAVITPLLCLFADNDALIRAPRPSRSDAVVYEIARGAGHSGFVSPPWPGHATWLAQRLAGFFRARN